MKWWQRFFHFLLGCDEQILGWSPLGNPIVTCPLCSKFWIVFGALGDVRNTLTEQQAHALALHIKKPVTK